MHFSPFPLLQAFYESNFVEKGRLEDYKQELEAKVCERNCLLPLETKTLEAIFSDFRDMWMM